MDNGKFLIRVQKLEAIIYKINKGFELTESEEKIVQEIVGVVN